MWRCKCNSCGKTYLWLPAMGKNICPNCKSHNIKLIKEIAPIKNAFEEWEKTYNLDGTLKEKTKKKGWLAKFFNK